MAKEAHIFKIKRIKQEKHKGKRSEKKNITKRLNIIAFNAD